MRPHSPNWLWQPEEPPPRRRGAPPPPSNVPAAMAGFVPGTGSFEAGAPPAGTAALPAPYDWDGTGAVPDPVYQLALGLGHVLAMQVPAQSASVDVAGFLAGVYAGLVAGTEAHPGEGCGLSDAAVVQAVRQAAPSGPAAIVFALQELVRGTRCESLIKNPIPMQVAPPASSPTATPVSVPSVPVVPEEKGFPWGWVLGGVGLVVVLGVGIYFATRRPKRSNPCGSRCSNPRSPPRRRRNSDVIDTEGYEVFEPPFEVRNPSRRRRTRRARKKKTAPRTRRRRRNIAPSTRSRMASGAFAIPERRIFPIGSKRQARRALTFAEWPNNRKWRSRVHRAVFARYPELRSEWSHRRSRNPSVDDGLLELDTPYASPVMRQRNPKKPARKRRRAKR